MQCFATATPTLRAPAAKSCNLNYSSSTYYFYSIWMLRLGSICVYVLKSANSSPQLPLPKPKPSPPFFVNQHMNYPYFFWYFYGAAWPLQQRPHPTTSLNLESFRSSWQTRIHFSNLHINRASYSAPLLLHDYICHSFDSLKKLEFARQQKSCRPRFTTLSKVLLLLL